MPKKFSILLLLILCGNLTWASPPHSFPEARKIIYQIFRNHPKTLYCSCRFTEKHQVDLNSCHMSAATGKKRAHVVEIEHIVAADALGHQLTCWQNNLCEHHSKRYKGRKCCEKSDHLFRKMESELYNLWPAVGLVNIARSNYSYGWVNSKDNFYGCGFKINKPTKCRAVQ